MSAEYAQLNSGTNFRKNPQLNRSGRGEQRVLLAKVAVGYALRTSRSKRGLASPDIGAATTPVKGGFGNYFLVFYLRVTQDPIYQQMKAQHTKIQEV